VQGPLQQSLDGKKSTSEQHIMVTMVTKPGLKQSLKLGFKDDMQRFCGYLK